MSNRHNIHAGIANKILRLLANFRASNSAEAVRLIEIFTQKQKLDLLILDEAERLNRKSLEMVRSIYDRTKIPIMLIGMPDILRHLRSHKKFYSRIGISYHYEPLSHEQLAEYLSQLHPHLEDIDIKLEKELLDFIYKRTKGEFRRIIQLVKQAERVRNANNHPVLSLGVFEAASKFLLDNL